MSNQMGTPPAGWYDDPTAAGQKRWWDGTQWTDDVRPAAPPATPPPPGGPVPPAPAPASAPFPPPVDPTQPYATPVPAPPQYGVPPGAGVGPAPPSPARSSGCGSRALLILVVVAFLFLGGCGVGALLLVRAGNEAVDSFEETYGVDLDDGIDADDMADLADEMDLDDLIDPEDGIDLEALEDLVDPDDPDDPDDTDDTDSEADGAGGASEQPALDDETFPYGEQVDLTWQSFGDADESVWRTIVGEPTDITDAALAASPLNQEPPDGVRYVGVDVEMTLLEATKEPLSPGFNFSWEIVGGATNRAYDINTIATEFFGCGVADDSFDIFDEAFVGGTLSGTVCVPLPEEDLGHPDTRVALRFLTGNRVYFQNR